VHININPYKYTHKTDTGQRVPGLHFFYLHSNLHDGLRKLTYNETTCITAVHCHPRSMILIPLESMCAASYLGPILHCSETWRLTGQNIVTYHNHLI